MARRELGRFARVCVALTATAAVALPATAGAAPFAKRTLRVGTHGADVKQLQKYLEAVGISTSVDGQYGRGTAAAVKKFERAASQTVDGKATPSEQAALRKAAQSGQSIDDVAAGSGGTTYAADQGNATAKAQLSPDGQTAIAPDSAPQQVKDAIAAANNITSKPYKYGGGHGDFEDTGYDCSGSVSYALHGGGFLDQPEDSTGLESFGAAGKGQWITVYANSGHAWAVIAGLRFDTSGDSSGSGPRWHKDIAPTSGYVVRHAIGF